MGVYKAGLLSVHKGMEPGKTDWETELEGEEKELVVSTNVNSVSSKTKCLRTKIVPEEF